MAHWEKYNYRQPIKVWLVVWTITTHFSRCMWLCFNKPVYVCECLNCDLCTCTKIMYENICMTEHSTISSSDWNPHALLLFSLLLELIFIWNSFSTYPRYLIIFLHDLILCVDSLNNCQVSSVFLLHPSLSFITVSYISKVIASWDYFSQSLDIRNMLINFLTFLK